MYLNTMYLDSAQLCVVIQLNYRIIKTELITVLSIIFLLYKTKYYNGEYWKLLKHFDGYLF